MDVRQHITKIRRERGQAKDMRKVLGFYKEITLNIALKIFMIFSERQIAWSSWAVLQDQK